MNNKTCHSNPYNSGFTLPEVLVALGIIAVLAAFTIPTLVQDSNEKATVVAVKKTYSTLSNAYTLAVQENGTPDTWDLIDYPDSQGALNILAKFVPYLRIVKNCGTDPGCFPTVPYKTLHWANIRDLNNDVGVSKVQLADGVIIGFLGYSACGSSRGTTQALQNVCGAVYIDTNGLKNPNIVGKDLFYVYITKYGLSPVGSAFDNSDTFSGQCLDGRGWGCAAWVIYNNNMDYLHCNDLAWSGKAKCD